VEEESSPIPQTKTRKSANVASKSAFQFTSKGNEEPEGGIDSESHTEVNSKAKAICNRWDEIDPSMMYEFDYSTCNDFLYLASLYRPNLN
jgi:hypothetical protein